MPDLDDFFAFKNSSSNNSDNNGGGNFDPSKWILVLFVIILLSILGQCSG